ncbi:hypothetical protein [Paraburkholderia sp. UCT31]|uniref:hypothetical protein n=1 Tax=Paraburkholderia sp. UCT31 TaxID=2615209 RepID=UPI001CA430F5|nr:hypothetical protein [Paraburkholderia sp. UCT31]
MQAAADRAPLAVPGSMFDALLREPRKSRALYTVAKTSPKKVSSGKELTTRPFTAE